MPRRYFPLVLVFLVLGLTITAWADSTTVPRADSLLKPKRSPMGALLRSAALPGWGQFYNHKYTKGTVVAAAETFFIVKAIHWWRKTEDQYSAIQQTTDQIEQYNRFNLYRSYRTRRDDYLWATGITIFVSMFDAYVDAHLAGFDIDVTPNFQPENNSAGIKLNLRF